MISRPQHLALVGPTASGKSAVAQHVAQAHPQIEIVSVDSMQVYRGMDIGTAKPSRAEQTAVPHHLIDIVSPSEDFTVAAFQEAFREVIADIEGRGHIALAVGGTGLYHRAALDDLEIPGEYPDVRARLELDEDTEGLHRQLVELDPLGASRIDPENRRRTIRALEVTLGSGRPFSDHGPGISEYAPNRFSTVGLWLPREVIKERVARRLERLMASGFVDEVRNLLSAPGGLGRNASQALGYREIARALSDGTSIEDATDRAIIQTRRFARRQMRWFERDPRICWVGHPTDGSELAEDLERYWVRPFLDQAHGD